MPPPQLPADDPFAPAPGESDGETALPRQALLRVAIAAAVLVAASLIPYGFSALDDYRYWQRIDVAPLVRAVTWQEPAAPEVAAAGPAPSKDDDLDDDAVAQLAGIKGQPAELPRAASQDVGLARLPAEASAASPLVIGDDVLGDQKVWLQGELADGAPLFKALTELAQGRRSHVRIAHYGDSHIANDGITHVTRLLLQARFGDGGHGFVLPQGRTEWYAHKGVELGPSEGWTLYNFLNGNAKDGAYGYGGVAVEGGAGEFASFKTGGKTLWSQAIVYGRSKGKAQWQAKIDSAAPQKLDVGEAAGTDYAKEIKAPDGKHALNLRAVAGRVRLFGVAFERDRGVVYDSLGEVGARGVRWLNADEEHLKAAMALRQPDAIIVNYGGNERLDRLAEKTYVERMNKVVTLLKGGRADVACLVFGPSDHGMREKGAVISDPAIVKLIGWQRKVAKESRCLFFDTRAVMGGDGAMGRWVKQGLGWSDYSHFTAAGERAMGQATYRAILKGLRDWRKTQK